MTIENLNSTMPPWLHSTKEKNFVQETMEWLSKTKKSYKLFFLDGEKMRTFDSFYDELQRKFDFPDYFGRNLNALNDCLTDGNILEGEGFILLMVNCDSIFSDESLELDIRDFELEGFLNSLDFVAKTWAKPIVLGEWWDRPAKPFHAIFRISENSNNLFKHLPQVTF